VNARLTFPMLALAVASASVRAQPAGAAPLGRDEVARQVIDARASGALRRTGEAGPRGDAAYAAQVAAPPVVTRSLQSDLVLQARRAHELAHPGPTSPHDEIADAHARSAPPTRTRAEVRQQVHEALAGAGPNPGGLGRYPDPTPRRSVFAKPPDAGERTMATQGK